MGSRYDQPRHQLGWGMSRSRRELRAEIDRLKTITKAGFNAWCEGIDAAPWQAHLALVADQAYREGYSEGFKAGQESAGITGEDIPEWLTTEADYEAAPVGTLVAFSEDAIALEKCASHQGWWHFAGTICASESSFYSNSNAGMALGHLRRVIRWGRMGCPGTPDA